MKKLLILAILGGVGFWYYKNIYALPIYGEWAPNEKEFMRQAYEKSTITPAQERQLKSYISNARVVINRGGDAEFRFPDQSGNFPYKLSQSSPGCYSLDVSQLGNFEACIEGTSMKMRNTKTGYVETYDKI